MTTPLLIFVLLLSPFTFILGLLTGAWIWYRAKAGKSPIPELPTREPARKVPLPADEVPIRPQAKL